MHLPGRNQKTCFPGGNGATAPPFWNDYFQPTRKGGGGLTPPNIWSCNGNLLPMHCKTLQNAAKRHKTPQNAVKHRKTPQNTAKRQKATKHRKTPQNATNALTVAANFPQNAGKRQKTPENVAKRRKTPQILQICDKSLWDQIFGGAKKPAPFQVC